jgi:hypothetical protein
MIRRTTAVCILVFSSFPAHAYASPIGPSGLLLGLIGAVIGIAVAINLARRAKASKPLQFVLTIPAASVGLLVGGIGGVTLGTGVDLTIIAMKYKPHRDYSTLPLRVAACDGDIEKVRAILAKKLDRKTKRNLARVAFVCSSAIENGAEIFAALIPAVHALYVSGDGPTPTQRDPHDYCYILDHSISFVRLDRLRLIQRLGLPLHCAEGSSQLKLQGLVNPSNDAPSADQYRELLALVGPELVSWRSSSSQSLLDVFVQHHEAFFIESALELGIDPAYAPGASMQFTNHAPARVRWILRRFLNQPASHLQREPLTQEEIARIDRMMGRPTAQEINAFTFETDSEPLLHQIDNFGRDPDGEAAFFRYVRALGGDLGLATRWRRQSLLAGHRRIEAPLMAALEELNREEVLRLAHPVFPETGEQGEPLVKSARERGNDQLLAFLCKRIGEGCSAGSEVSGAR